VAFLLVIIAAVVMLFGVTRISRTGAQHGTPWAALLVWAVLFSAGLLIWLMSARIQ